jgi:hypothetical protein
MKFNTQICTTIKQSKRLLELGLDADTSDMLIIPLPNGKELIVQKFADESGNLYYKIKGEQWESSPAWSLHRLISMLPDEIEWMSIMLLRTLYFRPVFYKDKIAYTDTEGWRHVFNEKDNIYDNIIDCIEWLIKENHINKNYLKEK